MPLSRLLATCAAGVIAAAAASAAQAVDLVIATVDNRQMADMQRLASEFERTHPGIRLQWKVLGEDELRKRVAADVAARTGAFDVVTIGMYEAPIWAGKGWLREFQPDADYDVRDLLPPIRAGLSWNGRLYAAPFYGESSMTLYRADLLEKAGVSFAQRPTWTQVREAAAKIHNPQAGVYGVCLRGQPGWGANMALVTTMVNAFGGQWFDMQWKPRIDTPEWRSAVGAYVELLTRYGPPGAVNNNFNENLQLFTQGKCGIWVDATVAGAAVLDAKFSRVADKAGFALAPTGATAQGAGWLWAWALAIPASSPRADAAQAFVRWATSKAYLDLVANKLGVLSMPTGTRISTYRNKAFLSAARYALIESVAISMADPRDATLPRSPYVGVQFAAIPEFQAIGIAVGQQMSAALAGKTSVDAALKASQVAADREMKKAGYYK